MVAQPKALEDYTADERAQIKLWSELLEEWQRYRNDPAQTSKAGVDKAFCAMLTLTRPELQVSEPTLYRKWRAYRMGDLDGLVDKRGKWRKGRTGHAQRTVGTHFWTTTWINVSIPYQNASSMLACGRKNTIRI